MERIAEALNKIRDHNPELVPEIPGFDQIRGMRNIIVHQYHAVNLDIVWDSMVKDIPELQEVTLRLLAKLDPQQTPNDDSDSGSAPPSFRPGI
ncbi:MAG: DUF86 domain-containing protein [Rhodobacteraceae bacterium]|nr:DUF86 domain-containing protein [Paracoccaceae bacterium]